ncbi:hypothetical protein QL285_059850 [Trifolium repens]|nr:hypothetical protein QL285_059850 [Trifolium repens]
MRSFTGNLHRISAIRSKVRVGSGGGDVRVPVELINRCFVVLVVCRVSEREETMSFGSCSSSLNCAISLQLTKWYGNTNAAPIFFNYVTSIAFQSRVL